MKKCSCCQEEKNIEEFYKQKTSKDGLMSICKKCSRIKSKKYHQENKELIRKNKKEYRQKKIDEIKTKDKIRHQLKREVKIEKYFQNREEILIKKRANYHSAKEHHRELARKRYHRRKLNNPQGIIKTRKDFYLRHKDEPEYKLMKSIRWGLARISKNLKKNKKLRSIEYLGCSLEEFKEYIEKLWEEGMSWENYGLYGWHIDHIIPLDWFLKNDQNPWKANHYTNLQPMWAKENLSKGNKFD